ncbi:hypothetical protein GE061_002997 [Apolygus lucorum]|uniref:UDP-glucuronosyltransferase n=1 Tax=Apolygus lucorum TaxID=248454 RepID=A0A6A4JLX7_APOLU|nr:hypothetical protein GE061_002997 [Apolygus lucorum]
MSRTNLIVVLLVVLLGSAAESARILVFFCQTARSHHIVFQPVIRELALRGHEVDYYTHVPLKDPPKNLNQIVFPHLEQSMKVMEEMSMVEWGQMPKVPLEVFMRTAGLELPGLDCHNFPEVKELLSSDKKYDMVIGEFFFYVEHFAYLIHRFDALGVAFSSNPDMSWLNEMSGLPDNPAYMSNFLSDFPGRMSFFERVKNTVMSTIVKAIDVYYVKTRLQSVADEHLRYEGWESRRSIFQEASDLALILTNSHHSLGYPSPTAPHVKGIMGTNVAENPKPLPKDIQDFMDSAEHGVVYLSWGSMLSVKELRNLGGYDPFVKIFGSLKQKVIWKWTSWSGEEPPVLPNIMFSKWLPQQSILAHNKTKLFITHSGLGGMGEAITYGVPMIGIPVFGDQFRNTKFMSSVGFGIGIDVFNMTEASLSWAINEVLTNPRYKEEAERRSLIFKDRPMKPVDEAVYWIEYVLRHGKVLQPASATMPFYQLYLLDVFAALALTLIVIFVVVKRTIRLLFRFIFNRNGNHGKTKATVSKKTD